MGDYCIHDNLNKDLTYNKVQQAINKARQEKAPGFENILNEMLKSDKLFYILYELFKACFESGIIPSIWSTIVLTSSPVEICGFI